MRARAPGDARSVGGGEDTGIRPFTGVIQVASSKTMLADLPPARAWIIDPFCGELVYMLAVRSAAVGESDFGDVTW